VIIYFDDIDATEICPEFKAYRTHGVAKQQPSPIIIYDYYDNCKFIILSILISEIIWNFYFQLVMLEYFTIHLKFPFAIFVAMKMNAVVHVKLLP